MFDLSSLNDEQRDAVTTLDRPVLVLAGPGTGKTQLLSARVAHILAETDTPASAILCLTFTDSGARAMRDRLTSFIQDSAYQVEINTYHGFSQTIISQNRDYFADQHLDKVVDFITQYNFIQEIQATLPQNSLLKNGRPKDILSTIADLKQAMIDPELLLKVADENKLQVDAINKQLKKIMADFKRMSKYELVLPYFEKIKAVLEAVAPTKSCLKGFPPLAQIALRDLNDALMEAEEGAKPSTKPLTAWKDNFLKKDKENYFVFGDNFNDIRLRTLHYIYTEYNAKMTAAGLYDFNDMILKTIATIEKNPDLKYNLQEKYLHILLDEYQDTNRAQSRLIELLTDNPVNEGKPNIMAVGDDDQAIYAFQGALYSNMIDFYNAYREVRLVNLTKSYRSHDDILRTAKNIAEQIEDRLVNNLGIAGLTKDITAANTKIKSSKIERLDFPNPLAEYAGVAEQIDQLRSEGEDLNEVAVLAPKHKYLESLTPYLAALNLPIRYEKSENALDNPGIKLLLDLARLISAVANRQPHNDLVFAVLSYPVWQLDTPVLWELAWQAGNRNSWLDFILKSDDFTELKPFTYWVMEFAKLTDRVSLEANFDYLIGNATIDYSLDKKSEKFESPIRQYYEKSKPSELIDFILDVNLLRESYINYGKNHSQANVKPLERLIMLADAYTNAEEKLSRTNSYNEGSDAVNLMTAFSAKGLEFKHVFILEANDKTWGNSRSNSNKIALPFNLRPIRHDRETLDEKARLLFVAITRAKTNLYLVNSLASLTGKNHTRLRFLKEVADGEDWFAKVIPEKYAKITEVSVEADAKQLSNNLLDNFTGWQDRHLDNIHSFADLLQPRLEKYKLSATGFNSYTDLIYHGPKDYFLDNVLGFPGSYNIHALYGIGIHYVLERLQNSGKPIKAATAIKLFKQRIDDFDLAETDFNKLVERAETALVKFITERAELFTTDKNTTVKTEENYYSQHIVLGEARLTGTIDRLEINKNDKTITIVDFKTGRSYADVEKNTSWHRHLKQLHFYRLMLLASKRFPGYDVNRWRIEFVDPDQTGKINYVTGEFDEVEATRVSQLISAVWQRTMTLNFTEPIPIPGQQIDLAQIKKFEQALLDEYGA